MDWQNDPELEKLFKGELDERAQSLVEGAQAMLDGEVSLELAGRMLREGHTIKGTGRVMGYEAIARGGETCEVVWRWIQQGEIESSSMLARTLMLLAEAIPEALGGDIEPVSMAIDTVRELVSDAAQLEQLPEPFIDDAEAGAEDTVTDDVELEEESAEEASAEENEDDTPGDEAPEDVDESGDDSVPDFTDEASSGDPEADVDEGSVEELEDGTHGRALEADDDAAIVAAIDAIEEEIVAGDRSDEDQPVVLDGEGVDASEDDRAAPDDPSEAQDEGDVSPATAIDSGDALVFEPGPDGRLPTPVITYEIVHDAFDGVEPVAGVRTSGSPDMLAEPPSLSVVGDERSILDPESIDAYDMGGLVGAVEAWAAEESVPVNAGRLFRMINDVAALRIDLTGTVRQTEQVLNSAEGVSAAAVEGALESLEGIRRAADRLESAALGLTMVSLSNITSTLPQLARYLSKRVKRDIELVIEGEDTPVDRQMVDRVGEIIRHLVVNALAHGIEDRETRIARGKSEHGTVKLTMSRNDQHLQIVVADDGGGVDWSTVREMAQRKELIGDDPTSDQLRSVLFSEGFSTAPGASEFTGDGDGLARVTAIVEEVFGTMTMETAPGRGTTFVITMPAHRALQRAQIFTAGDHSWGIPESSVLAILNIQDVAISVTEHGSTIGYGTETVPYSSFATVAGLDIEGLPSQVIVMQSPTGPIALAVDDVLSLHEVATKDLGPLLSGASVVSGVALLGAEETVMLVDPGRLADSLRDLEVRPPGPVHTVLVVDDSQGVRQVVSGVLASHGFSTVSAGSVSDALAALAKNDIDALVVDFSMPRADGVALVHMVRQRYGDIPVVMLSGVASQEDRSRAERAGVHAFFDKADFAKGALVDKLRELIDERSANKEAEIAS
jgi:chemotaxis protein histidine kinase CheA